MVSIRLKQQQRQVTRSVAKINVSVPDLITKALEIQQWVWIALITMIKNVKHVPEIIPSKNLTETKHVSLVKAVELEPIRFPSALPTAIESVGRMCAHVVMEQQQQGPSAPQMVQKYVRIVLKVM